MIIFSFISIFAFMAYLYIGIYTFNLCKKSKINKLFLTWCISMAIWSFAYYFVYAVYPNENVWRQYIWMKISAIGWCSFSSIILHLALLLTENKAVEKLKIKILIYTPGIVFFLTTVIFFRPDYTTPFFIEKFFYIGDFIYNFSFLSACIFIIYLWGKKSDNIRIKKQSTIICISSTVPFALNLLTQTILPALGIRSMPLMGQIYSLIMVFGAYYAIRRYKLFNISTERLIDEILSEIVDIFLLLSPKGEIIRVSKSTEILLQYHEGEILDKNISSIIRNIDLLKDVNKIKEPVSKKYSEIDFLKKDGGLMPASISCSYIVDEKLKDLLGIAIVGHDITIMKNLEREIEEHKKAKKLLEENNEKFLYFAYHDNLTGVPNRKFFYERLENELKAAKGNNSKFAVFFIDLDNFKDINDCYGHEMGDFLLIEAARRIKECIKEIDIVSRFGGDEFAVLVYDVSSLEDALKIVDKITAAIGDPVCKEGKCIAVKGSVGISIYPDNGKDADTLINDADKKMYKVKNHKKEKNHCE